MIKILIVDDDISLQNIYKSIFPLGAIDIVDQAFDGAEAVRVASGSEFDVIIMDQRMPIMDGITATKKILEQKKMLGYFF